MSTGPAGYAADFPPPSDPTDPYEPVEKEFMNRLALIITAAESALQAGKGDVELTDEFYMQRGEFLDLLQHAQVTDWLRWMRLHNRAKFQTYAVGD